jgi:hypothetical protein
MTQVYFHCSNANGWVLVDRCGAVVDDLAEARDHAACVDRSVSRRGRNTYGEIRRTPPWLRQGPGVGFY